MSSRLPEQVAPCALADSGRQLQGQVRIASLQRLQDVLHDAAGALEVRMRFGLSEQGVRYVAGSIAGTLTLCCQRCLEGVAFPVEIDFRVGLVRGPDEAERLPEGFEPLILAEDRVRPADLVEDELLLAIPDMPVHGQAETCVLPGGFRNTGPDGDEKAGGDNPFSILSTLKRT